MLALTPLTICTLCVPILNFLSLFRIVDVFPLLVIVIFLFLF